MEGAHKITTLKARSGGAIVEGNMKTQLRVCMGLVWIDVDDLLLHLYIRTGPGQLLDLFAVKLPDSSRCRKRFNLHFRFGQLRTVRVSFH